MNIRCFNKSHGYIPYAVAGIKGSKEYNSIKGIAKLFSWKDGTIVKIEIIGLPSNDKNNFFGFHIHEGNICTEKDGEEAFKSAGGHLNIEDDKHPQHIGDLPMIYSNLGYCYMEFFTSRFKPNDVLGRTIIVHKDKDDLMTEPAGNSGNRIACGVITQFK